MRPGGLAPGHEPGLWLALGDGLAQFLRGAAGGEAWLCGGSALVLSGEPVADLNYALIGPGADAPALLRRFAGELRRRDLPAWIEVDAGWPQGSDSCGTSSGSPTPAGRRSWSADLSRSRRAAASSRSRRSAVAPSWRTPAP